ncbi:MAG: xanthine phosphoribosyltransferase [Bacilli bacterium]|nr:xanthine phosphoribosyltransferase [Bacilli bacterium]
MKYLEDIILKDGKIIDNKIIKVDNFLNHQIKPEVINEFAKAVVEHFKGVKIDKVLTIETSGIAVAYAVAEQLGNVPLLFARKTKSKTMIDDLYTATVKSFTRGIFSEISVSKNFLSEGENILIIDDFLAEGNAAEGLISICQQAKANVVGYATVIEKYFQGGRKKIEAHGIDVFSGACIKEFKDNKPVF